MGMNQRYGSIFEEYEQGRQSQKRIKVRQHQCDDTHLHTPTYFRKVQQVQSSRGGKRSAGKGLV